MRPKRRFSSDGRLVREYREAGERRRIQKAGVGTRKDRDGGCPWPNTVPERFDVHSYLPGLS
jgi:hypothetical protein